MAVDWTCQSGASHRCWTCTRPSTSCSRKRDPSDQVAILHRSMVQVAIPPQASPFPRCSGCNDLDLVRITHIFIPAHVFFIQHVNHEYPVLPYCLMYPRPQHAPFLQDSRHYSSHRHGHKVLAHLGVRTSIEVTLYFRLYLQGNTHTVWVLAICGIYCWKLDGWIFFYY